MTPVSLLEPPRTTSDVAPSRTGRRRIRVVLGLLLVGALVVGVAAYVVVGRRGSTPAAPDPATVAARAFLDEYVDGDGRVVRRDQGGDTVSEGQAYALLLAAVVDDRTRFDEVW